MLTTVTQMVLKEGSEAEWDDAMRARLNAVQKRSGWLSGEVLKPLDGGPRRIVVGNWKTREDWEAWHKDSEFQATRERLDELETEPRRQWWHEVTVSAQK